MTMINYRPGTSVLHRAPAAVKIIGLLAGISVVVAVNSPIALAACAAGVLALWLLSGVGLSLLVAQLWSLRWFLGLLMIFQCIVAGAGPATVVVGDLALAVLLASLLTRTTPTAALLDLTARLLGPLRRFGVDPDRVGLALALTIRAVPVVTEIIDEVVQARRARGVEWSLRALAVPVIVRTLRTADGIGESLLARGADD